MADRIMKMASNHIIATTVVVLGTVLTINYVLYRVKHRARYPRELVIRTPQGQIRTSQGALEDLILGAAQGVENVRISGVQLQRKGQFFSFLIDAQVLSGANGLIAHQAMETSTRQALVQFVGESISEMPIQIQLRVS